MGGEHIRTLDVARHAAAGNLLRDTILAFPSLAPLDIACAIAFEEGRRFEMQRARAAKMAARKRAAARSPAHGKALALHHEAQGSRP